MKQRYTFGFGLLLLVLFTCSLARAQTERITAFDSYITVNADSTLVVRETIRVYSTGEKIQHDIYRDFPTVYRNKQGKRVRVGYSVLAATRDGVSEQYHQQKQSNGIRTYLGNPDMLLDPGPHTYVLTYQTDHQLGFFPDHDELYWNVTGNDWEFPIDSVTATVVLPPGISKAQMHVEGYTGAQGSKAHDLTGVVTKDGEAKFHATKPLAPYEGMTIVVTFPKRYIQPPTRRPVSLKGHAGVIAAGLGLLFLLLYYYAAWLQVGKDPQKGVIIPRYEPPDQLSPAAVRFIRRMGFDDKALTAAIINLAVKGRLRIENNSINGSYQLVRVGASFNKEQEAVLTALADGKPVDVMTLADRVNLSPSRTRSTTEALAAAGVPVRITDDTFCLAIDQQSPYPVLPEEEQFIFKRLLAITPTLPVSDSHYKVFEPAEEGTEKILKNRYGTVFQLNRGFGTAGILLSLLLAMLVAWLTMQPGNIEPWMLPASMEGDIWVAYVVGTLFSVVGLGLFFGLALPAWRFSSNPGDNFGGCGNTFGALLLTGFSLPFAAAGLFALFAVSITYLAFLLCAAAVAFIFFRLLRAYTPEGRRIMDGIEGFRMYLSVAEEERLNLANPPERTPQLFEQFLPYALALDVEQQWAEQFNDVLARAGTAAYQPGWYSGSAWSSYGPVGFSEDLGDAFSSAVSSSTTAPGSSSGSGGGGSSGGGGGGGGW